ncbi:MAG: hypothetical protein IIA70_01425 [Proteobacteria bacterium]|nr:hypothetical protein [Pseudomonadota bacterium]
MTALAKNNKTSNSAKPARGQMDIFISRGKVLFHLAFWSAALMAIGWVFILPYRELSGAAGREFPHRLIELLGDEFFLGVGVLICGLILWYMAIMAAKMLVKGPLFRVSKEGLWLCQVNNFFIPRKFIRSIFFEYRQGFVSAVVLELNDQKILQTLHNRLPKLAFITCNLDRSYLRIELSGVKNKKTFTRALANLANRLR